MSLIANVGTPGKFNNVFLINREFSDSEPGILIIHALHNFTVIVLHYRTGIAAFFRTMPEIGCWTALLVGHCWLRRKTVCPMAECRSLFSPAFTLVFYRDLSMKIAVISVKALGNPCYTP